VYLSILIEGLNLAAWETSLVTSREVVTVPQAERELEPSWPSFPEHLGLPRMTSGDVATGPEGLESASRTVSCNRPAERLSSPRSAAGVSVGEPG
jgi:hypothetical protein